MKDLNVRQETIKILQEKTGSNLFDLSWSNFLLAFSKSKGIKSKNKLLGTILGHVGGQRQGVAAFQVALHEVDRKSVV